MASADELLYDGFYGTQTQPSSLMTQPGPEPQPVSTPSTSSSAYPNPSSIAELIENVAIADPGSQGVVPLAYTLATQTAPDLPAYRVAGFSRDQQRAFRQARQLLGAYDPYLQQGYGTTLAGIGAMGQALGGTQALAGQIPSTLQPGERALTTARRQTQLAAQSSDPVVQQGIAALQSSGEMYSPDMIAPFMSEYEDAAVQQALEDIARQGEIQAQDIAAQAVDAGAFGGSRQAIAEAELERNVLEQQGRTAAEMRASGYESAAQQSQQAYEQAQARTQQAAQAAGQLAQQQSQLGMTAAQQAGNLGLQQSELGLQGVQAGLGAQQQAAGIGQGLGALGQQQLGFGQAQQQLGQQDVNMLYSIGQQQQAQQQAILDAYRMTQQQEQMLPYQQLAYASDIITGAPTGITSILSQPGPSPVSQVGGLALGAGSMYSSGLFGGE